MCHISIEISNGTIMKVCSDSHTARLVIVDNDKQTITQMVVCQECDRTQSAYELAIHTEKTHTIKNG